MKLIINNNLVSNKCKLAKTFWAKLRGKFFIKEPVYLQNCNSIHTIFMRKNIDVIFLDKNNKVVKIYENILPRCIIFPIFNAQSAVEFDAGFIKSAKIKLGDIVTLEE